MEDLEKEDKNPRISDDIANFDDWFTEKVCAEDSKFFETHNVRRMKETMRSAWRQCAKIKNEEIKVLHSESDKLAIEIEKLKKEKEALVADLQMLTMKFRQLEKGQKK